MHKRQAFWKSPSLLCQTSRCRKMKIRNNIEDKLALFSSCLIVLSSLPGYTRPFFLGEFRNFPQKARDVGTGGRWGHVPPQDFSINKEVPFSCLEDAPFFLRKNVPSKCRAPQVWYASYVPEGPIHTAPFSYGNGTKVGEGDYFHIFLCPQPLGESMSASSINSLSAH